MEPEKKKKLNRNLMEWGVIVVVFLLLYITGLHTTVIGTLQSFVLKTGLIRPDINPDEELGWAEYRFPLVTSTGENVSLEAYRGKVVFINFWATWCPPCVAEMPDINRLYEKLDGENIVFLIISLDEDFDKAIKFVKKRGFSFPIYSPVSYVPDEFHSQVIPTTFVVSPEGKIMVKKQGMAEYNSRKFRDFLLSLR
jgi:thiol-disulfide isomerase/thioredoxin